MVLHALNLALPDCLNLRESDVVLAVVPMFHVNAWGLPFTCAMLGQPGRCCRARTWTRPAWSSCSRPSASR